MPVDIRGKQYLPVAERIAKFREEHEHKFSLETQLIKNDDERVIIKALIMDGEKVLATGYAEEERGSSNINQTSALENCETSAVGRCLAMFGYAGSEIRSLDEQVTAEIQQFEKRTNERWADFTTALLANYESIMQIKDFLLQAIDDERYYDSAREVMDGISNDDKQALNRAWTKGGVFTPTETKQIKWWSNEWQVSRKGKEGGE